MARAPDFYRNRRRGGGVSEEESQEGEGRRGNVCGEGGGLNRKDYIHKFLIAELITR